MNRWLHNFRVLHFSFFILVSSLGYSQTWSWAKGEGGIGNDAAYSITLDDQNNAYVTGNIAGKANFSGTEYQGRGIYDVFIAKYDATGNLIWVKLAGGYGNDIGNSIKWKNGFLYVCGGFEDTAYFESTALISKGSTDAFVAKYTDNGNLVWAKRAGGTGSDFASSLDVDNNGNIFVAGSYETAMQLDTFHLSTANFYSESYYAKYNNSGNVVWAKSTTGNNANLITGVAFDNQSSVFLTGYFGANFKLGNTSVVASTSSYDIFLAKVNTTDASEQWLKRAGSNYEDAAHGVCSDKDGNPSITGYFGGTAYFDSHSVTYSDYNDVFVAGYDSSGNNLWVKAGKGNKLDVGIAIAADTYGNIYATGMFQNVCDFDGNILHATNVLDRDIFLVSYDRAGNIRWITRAGDIDTDCGLGVTTAANGMVALCGYYLHTCIFGTIAIDYSDANDLFVAEYNPPVVGDGIDEAGEELAVSVYPNPATGNCRLSRNDVIAESGVYKITNAIGELIGTGELTASCQLPTANYCAGIYFIEISTARKTKTLKFVKQ